MRRKSNPQQDWQVAEFIFKVSAALLVGALVIAGLSRAGGW